jgi:hypothetical protein
MKKLRADCSRGMLAVIWCRIFCLPGCYPKNKKIRVYRTVVLRVVLYGCKTWSLTLREEQRLRAFENRVLRRIFGPKRDETTGEWRRLHNEELNDLYLSPNSIRVINSRKMRWTGHVARVGENRGAYRILVGRPSQRWEDYINPLKTKRMFYIRTQCVPRCKHSPLRL